MKFARRVDQREKALTAEIESRRLEVRRRAEAVGREAIASVDVRESVRENPVVGVLAAVSLGVVLGSLGGVPRPGRGREDRPGRNGHPFLSSVALDLTDRLLDMVLPSLPGLMNHLFQPAADPGPDPAEGADRESPDPGLSS